MTIRVTRRYGFSLAGKTCMTTYSSYIGFRGEIVPMYMSYTFSNLFRKFYRVFYQDLPKHLKREVDLVEEEVRQSLR